jgi:small basic protein
MPGAGRPGDPLWMAIGFAIGVIPGICFHQVYAGLGIGLALAVAFGLIREDMRRGYRRPTDPTRFTIGLAIGLLGGVWLHYLGLGWRLGMGLGLAFGFFLGATIGVSRANTR